MHRTQASGLQRPWNAGWADSEAPAHWGTREARVWLRDRGCRGRGRPPRPPGCRPWIPPRILMLCDSEKETGFGEHRGDPVRGARALRQPQPAHGDGHAAARPQPLAPEASSHDALSGAAAFLEEAAVSRRRLQSTARFPTLGAGASAPGCREGAPDPGHAPTLRTALLPRPELGPPALRQAEPLQGAGFALLSGRLSRSQGSRGQRSQTLQLPVRFGLWGGAGAYLCPRPRRTSLPAPNSYRRPPTPKWRAHLAFRSAAQGEGARVAA